MSQTLIVTRWRRRSGGRLGDAGVLGAGGQQPPVFIVIRVIAEIILSGPAHDRPTCRKTTRCMMGLKTEEDIVYIFFYISTVYIFFLVSFVLSFDVDCHFYWTAASLLPSFTLPHVPCYLNTYSSIICHASHHKPVSLSPRFSLRLSKHLTSVRVCKHIFTSMCLQIYTSTIYFFHTHIIDPSNIYLSIYFVYQPIYLSVHLPTFIYSSTNLHIYSFNTIYLTIKIYISINIYPYINIY